MFEENDIEKYRQIKAPEELKARVLSDCTETSSRKTVIYKRITVMAACLVMLVAAGFVCKSKLSANIYVNGDKFSGNELTVYNDNLNIASQRNVDECEYNIEINARIKTKISISNGEFLIWNAENDEFLFSGDEYTAKGKIMIKIDLDEGELAILKIKNLFFNKEIQIKSE